MTTIQTRQPATVTLKFTRPFPDRVNIFIDNGQQYFFRNVGGKYSEINVNFPIPGIYQTDAGQVHDITPLKISPIVQKITLPEHERTTNPEGISFHYNPEISSPARIFRHKGRIEKGPKFYALPYSLKLFILLHEIGHLYYKTEWKCDLFACYHFLKMGYNESSCLYALTNILHRSPMNDGRILKLFNTLIND